MVSCYKPKADSYGMEAIIHTKVQVGFAENKAWSHMTVTQHLGG